MMRKRNTLPKHVYPQSDATGKIRFRFRRKLGNHWQSAYLPGAPYSKEFNEAYEALMNSVRPPKKGVGQANTVSGSMDAAIVAWYQSAKFHELRPSTKATYKGISERLRRKTGKDRIGSLTRAKIQQAIDGMNDRPAAANRLISILRLIFDNAVNIGMIKSNPVIGVRGYAKKSKGFHSWTDDEIEQYRRFWEIGTRERLALELMLCTASRKSDAVRMGWQHLKGGRILIRQQKTGSEVDVKILPALQRCLDALPRNNLTFLVTFHGKPFTAKGFGNWFKDACRAAGLPHCTSHGLRKAMSRKLAEAGSTTVEIMSVTGHRSIAEVETYTRAAQNKRLADSAFDKLAETKIEQNVSQNNDILGKTRK